MPSGTIDSLEIEISASSAQAESKINGLVRSLSTLKTALGGNTTSGLKELSESMKSLKAALNFSIPKKLTTTMTEFSEALNKLDNTAVIKFGQAMKSLEGLGEIKLSKSIPDTIRELGIAVKDINTAELQVFGDTMKGLAGIEKIKLNKNLPETISELAKAVDEISDHALARLNSVTEALGRLKGVDLGVARAATRMKPSDAGRAADTEAPSVESAIADADGTVSGFKAKWLQFLAFLRKNVAKPKIETKGLKTSERESSGILSRFIKKVGELGSALKRIAMYRFLRTVIKSFTDALKTGINNLYEYSNALGKAGANNFAASMDSAASSLLYFKNSIGAAVAPLINSLVPALNAVIDKVVEAINWINQLLSKLAGASSWTRAKKVATEYADSAKKAGGAAKEALKYLAPFDELNVLPSDRAGGGGGGAEDIDYSSMFEEVDLGEKFKWLEPVINWFKEFKNEVKDLVDSLDFGPLEDAWNRLTEAVKPFIALVDEGLKWVWDNVLVPLSHWTIEAAIPAVLNMVAAALDFLSAVIEKIKPGLTWLWEKIIKPIAAAIGRAFISTLESITSLLQKLTDLVKGNTSFKDFIDSLDGKEVILLSIATAIGVVVTAMAGIKLATSIFQAFTTVISLVTSPVGLVIVAVTALAAIAIVVYKNWDKVKEVFETVKQKLQEFWQKVKDLMGKIKDAFTAPVAAIKSVWDGLVNTFQSVGNTISNAISKATGKTPATKTALVNGPTTSGGGRAFATGGFPEDGLFWANHNELVGRFSNGKTAVANNDQIVAGISAGVEDANESVVTAIYSAATQMVNAIRESGGGSDVDWNYVAQRVSRAQRSNARAMGTA